MAGGAETPNIAALPAIARLGACESTRGPDADRRVKLLIQFAVEGSLSGAYSHMELAAAVAAPQQSGQQQLAFTSCSASECAAHTGRIVGNYLDVVLELAPGDIGCVVILDQDIPFGHGLLHTT